MISIQPPQIKVTTIFGFANSDHWSAGILACIERRKARINHFTAKTPRTQRPQQRLSAPRQILSISLGISWLVNNGIPFISRSIANPARHSANRARASAGVAIINRRQINRISLRQSSSRRRFQFVFAGARAHDGEIGCDIIQKTVAFDYDARQTCTRDNASVTPAST